MDDIVRVSGYLCLGSRLRRIGERLQSDVQDMTIEAGLDVRVSHYPLLLALDREGPLTIGDLVEALGVSQPGVTAAVGRLAEAGLVSIETAQADRRVRRVTLTDGGRRLVDRARRELWPRIERAVAELCAGDADFLAMLDAIEAGLEAKSLGERSEAAIA